MHPENIAEIQWGIIVAIIIVVVIIVLVIAVASFIIGGIDQAVNAPPLVQNSPDPCIDCNNYNKWYNSLPTWRQNAEFAFYWVKRIDCAAKNCPFNP